MPVGVPVPWPSATPPTGWLKCNGAAFSSEMYPKLAKAYPTNKLPDLRGEFIRGWDDGRGIDAGRTLLSGQDGTRTSLFSLRWFDRLGLAIQKHTHMILWDSHCFNANQDSDLNSRFSFEGLIGELGE